MAEALREGASADVRCRMLLVGWYQVEASMCKCEKQFLEAPCCYYPATTSQSWYDRLNSLDNNYFLQTALYCSVPDSLPCWLSGDELAFLWVPTIGPQR